MKTLPNGLTIFNATPHVIRFWREGWNEPVEVEPDEKVDAEIVEVEYDRHDEQEDAYGWAEILDNGVYLVRTKFLDTDEGKQIIKSAWENGADIIVGSIVAAQAYPGLVVAMTPALGYERVPPAQKRARPDKFTIY